MADDVDPIDAELEKLDAELEKLDAEETKPLSSGIRRLLPVLLAVVTLGGFAGVVLYAYNTGIREGSEFAAPVLKPDGPSKVAPKNPGGQKSPTRTSSFTARSTSPPRGARWSDCCRRRRNRCRYRSSGNRRPFRSRN